MMGPYRFWSVVFWSQGNALRIRKKEKRMAPLESERKKNDWSAKVALRGMLRHFGAMISTTRCKQVILTYDSVTTTKKKESLKYNTL